MGRATLPALCLLLSLGSACVAAPVSERAGLRVEPYDPERPVAGVLRIVVIENVNGEAPAPPPDDPGAWSDYVAQYFGDEAALAAWRVGTPDELMLDPDGAAGAVGSEITAFWAALAPSRAVAVQAAMSDGPLPIGDVVGVGIVVIAGLEYAVQVYGPDLVRLGAQGIDWLRARFLSQATETLVQTALAQSVVRQYVDQTLASIDRGAPPEARCARLAPRPSTIAGYTTQGFMAALRIPGAGLQVGVFIACQPGAQVWATPGVIDFLTGWEPRITPLASVLVGVNVGDVPLRMTASPMDGHRLFMSGGWDPDLVMPRFVPIAIPVPPMYTGQLQHMIIAGAGASTLVSLAGSQ
jgi:hypothetical protein